MTAENRAYSSSLDIRASAPMTKTERQLRALQRKRLRIDLDAATLDAKILTIELGGPSAPIAAAAWSRVQQQHASYRAAVERIGLAAD